MNTHNPQFNQLTQTFLWEYFNKKGYQSDRQLLLSFDVDKTIVDRSRGAHFMSKAVKTMFQKLMESKHFIITMNTGRDAANYLPIQDQTNHKEPNIFVSGRVIRHQGKTHTDPQAVFSNVLKNNLWDQFIKGAIPFLDVKHSNGNTFFVKGSRGLERYYGHHRPIDWFDELQFDIIDADIEKTAQEKFDNLIVVRVEMPLLYKNEPIEVLHAINKEDSRKAQRIAEERLNIENNLDLLFVPAPVHSTRGEEMKTEIGSIRIVMHNKYVNKGTGLKYLAELLNIPEQNIICFGDSAGNKANDAIIKKVLPKATLIITDNGEQEAKEFADFIVEPVEKDGVPKAVDRLIEFQMRYSKFFVSGS